MLVDTISKVNNITFDSTNLNAYVSSLRGLSETQARVVLSSTSLDKIQKQQILNKIAETNATVSLTSAEATAALTKNLGSESEAVNLLIKSKLATQEQLLAGATIEVTSAKIADAVATGKLTKEEGLKISTAFGLTGANIGLGTSFKLLALQIWESIKAMGVWLVTTPTGVFTLIVGGLAAATLAVAKYNEKLEENRQKMIEAGKEASQLNKDLDGLVEEYRKLGEDGEFDNSDREQAKNIQQQINELLGDEVSYIDLANGKYEAQLKTLQKIQHEKAKDNYKTISDAKVAAEDSLLAITPKVTSGFNNTADESKLIKQVLKDYGFDKYIGTSENDNSASQIIHFAIDNSSAESTIQSLEDMKELRDVLRKSYEDEISTGGDLEDFYNNLDKKIGELSESVTKYKDALSDYNINEAVIQFNETEFDGVTGALIRNEDQLKKWLNSMLASEDISDGVKQELLGLASTYFPDMSDAVGEATKEYIKNQVAAGGDITSLKNLASTCGITEQAFDDLVFATTLFNNKEIDVDSKIAKLRELGYELDVVNTKMNGYYVKAGSGGQYVGDMQIETIDGKRYAVYYDNHNEVIKKELLTKEYNGGGNPPPYTPPGDKDKDKNKPDYEDPTDAIINRINLRSKELEQQEESIQNAIEIAELENDYKKQISLTNDLIAKRKDRLTELKTANAGLHNEAEWLRNSTPQWNEEEWFDSQGNATKAYIDFINDRIKSGADKEEVDAIKDQFEAISKYKKAYMDNAEEIAGINKEILQDEEKIWDLRREEFDARMEESEYYIQHSKDFGWENGDNEIAARNRVLDWIQSDYYKSLIKDDVEYYKLLEEHRLNYIEAQKEEFNKANDFASSYIDSQKTLLQSYFDVTNSIVEAQHEINKELETSKTMYEWLDEDSRKLLFNQEDYNTLSEELYDIQYKADKLRRQYERDLENSTLDTIEQITSNYEMQYDMLMKSYEIAKADLEIAKKKQKLNNVLNERNVRMFINGQWQWVANTQDVIDAKSELADAEYARRTAEAEKTQTESLNHLTAQQDELETVINMFESGVIDLGTAVYKVTQMFGSLPSAMQNALSLISRSSYSSSSNGTTYSYNGLSYDPNFDYSAAMKTVPVGSDAWNRMNQRRNAKILGEGLPSSMMFASGTRYTPSGNILMGEKESETFINANGHLIPINQPTLGNFGAGGIVFNQDQMANLRSLWDLSNIGIASHNNLIGANRTQNIDNRVDNSYHVYIQNLEVDNGVIDINALKRYIPIH